MRLLPTALCLPLLLLFPSNPSRPFLVQPAAAETQDALLQKCRKAVFRKYGRREMKDERRMLVMSNRQLISAVDQCVANGGRVM
ncbi:MAG: hypothetical protein ABWY92_03795 [Xanthobacteraceae bacterium]|jgi:hypothetical protein